MGHDAVHVATEGFDWSMPDAVLFDLDGVITPTAEVHEHAWSELFADYDYTHDDYLQYIDGKPRYDGVRSFLASRDVHLPEGDPTDAPGDTTVCALGNRKNALFAGSDEGGALWGVAASLIETCKLNGVEPHAYLTDVLTKLANRWPMSRIDELLPWAYAKTAADVA